MGGWCASLGAAKVFKRSFVWLHANTLSLSVIRQQCVFKLVHFFLCFRRNFLQKYVLSSTQCTLSGFYDTKLTTQYVFQYYIPSYILLLYVNIGIVKHLL